MKTNISENELTAVHKFILMRLHKTMLGKVILTATFAAVPFSGNKFSLALYLSVHFNISDENFTQNNMIHKNFKL